MKWQSEEHVGLAEAAEWARHFGQLETEMDQVLASLFNVPEAEMSRWIRPGKYISGRELAAAGMAELADLKALKLFQRNGESQERKRPKVVR